MKAETNRCRLRIIHPSSFLVYCQKLQVGAEMDVIQTDGQHHDQHTAGAGPWELGYRYAVAEFGSAELGRPKIRSNSQLNANV